MKQLKDSAESLEFSPIHCIDARRNLSKAFLLSGATKFNLLLICLLVIPSLAAAQPDPSLWSNLSQLRNGEKIEIVDAASKKHGGTFASFSDAGVTYRDSNGEQSIAKQDVRLVKTSAHKRTRHTLIGLGIGAGAGAGISAAVWEDHGFLGNKGAGAAFGAALGGVSGAIIGALWPGNRVIYRSAVH